MGNWFGRSNLIAKVPVRKDGIMMKSQVEGGRRSFDAPPSPSSPMRIKVRMTKKQLEELKAMADTSTGSSELGRMIIKECLEGKLSPRPRVVFRQHPILDSSRSRRLGLITIDEGILFANSK